MAVKNTWKRTFKFLDEEKKTLDVKFWSTLIWPEIVVHGKLMQAMPENTMMKTILPFKSLPYFSSNNCWADHRYKFDPETQMSFVLKSGPMSVEIAQTQLEENLMEGGMWIRVSREKTLGGVSSNLRVLHPGWISIFNYSLKHAHLNFWCEKICKYASPQSQWTLESVEMLWFPSKRERTEVSESEEETINLFKYLTNQKEYSLRIS